MKNKDCLYCFETAGTGTHRSIGGDCRAYPKQVAWTKRVRALLANETPWHARPVPEADYSPAGMEKWRRAQSFTARSCGEGGRPNLWYRDTLALLDKDGAPYRAFRRAVERAQ